VKLGQDNFLFWRAQFIPLLHSHCLQGFADGSYPCPLAQIPVPTEGGRMALVLNLEHRAWVMQDQAILSAIIESLTPAVSGLVLFATTTFDAWTTLNTSFGSRSTARAMQFCDKLSQMKKCDLSAHVFFNQVKIAADTLAQLLSPCATLSLLALSATVLTMSMMVWLQLLKVVRLLSPSMIYTSTS
jgi:hypothetical protein